jgi:hypothetical protein
MAEIKIQDLDKNIDGALILADSDSSVNGEAFKKTRNDVSFNPSCLSKKYQILREF